MADVLTHIDTLDVEVAPQEELDVTVGSPMEHSRVLSITKNGKYVVSGYDLAEVDVQPVVSGIKVTENGTYLPSDYDVDAFNKVEVQVDDTRRVMTEFVNNGGNFAFYKGTDVPLVDWNKVTTAVNLWRQMDLSRNQALSEKILKIQYPNSINNSYMFYSTKMVSSEPITINLYGANCRYTFGSCEWDVKELTIDAKNVTDLTNFFAYGGNSNNQTILLNSDSVEQFSGRTGLHKLNAIRCDSMVNFWNNVQNAIELGGFINLGKNLVANTSISFAQSPNLTHESILNIFNTIYDMNLRNKKVSVITKLGATNFAKVTEEEIKIATDKGWIVTQ